MEDISKIFHIDWKLLLAQVINFSLVLFLLQRFAFGPISKVLKERTKKIEDGLSMAQEAKKSLSFAEAKVAEMINEAKAESQKIVSRSQEEAEKIRQSEIEKTKSETEKLIENGKKSLFAEKENILMEIKNQAAEMVIAASLATLGNIPDLPKVDKGLAEEAIKSIEL